MSWHTKHTDPLLTASYRKHGDDAIKAAAEMGCTIDASSVETIDRRLYDDAISVIRALCAVAPYNWRDLEDPLCVQAWSDADEFLSRNDIRAVS